MRNIVNIDYSNITCNGAFNSASNTNELHLMVKPLDTQLSNYKVRIVDVKGITHDSGYITPSNDLDGEVINSQVPNDYFNGSGTMKVMLLSAQGNSAYINFNCIPFTTDDDITCKYADGAYLFSKAPESLSLIDLIYPVGSQIYNGDINFNPNNYYTGTVWKRIKGYVLAGVNEEDNPVAEYLSFNKPSGTTLGVPFHDLRAWIGAFNNDAASLAYKAAAPVPGQTFTYGLYHSGLSSDFHTRNHSTMVTGMDGREHVSILQPTQLTYIWERTA